MALLSTPQALDFDDPDSRPDLSIAGNPQGHRVSQLTKLGGVGFISSLLITLSSALRGWPFSNLTAEPWLFQWTSDRVSVRWLCLIAFYAGVIGLCWGWMRALKGARSGALTGRGLVLLFVLWIAPIMFAVPLFSGDVFVYYVDGQALARGYSPYQAGVDVLGPTPMVHMVHPVWRDTRTMYGPVFMRMAQAIAQVTDGHVVRGVLLFRAVAIASVSLMALGVASISRTLGRSVPRALAFSLLNPITILQLVGGTHNDASMVGLMMAGLAVGLAARKWPMQLFAIALCTTGAAFKAPAFAAIFVLAWIWAGYGSSLLRRLTFAAVAGAVGLVFLEIIGILSGLGWGWTKATNVPGIAYPMLAPANSFAFAFGGPFNVVKEVSSITRPLAMLVSVALGVWLVMRTSGISPAERVLRAGGWALLGLAWLGPAVYPWYLVWGVVIVGITGAGRLHKALVVMTIAVTFVVAPGGYGWFDGWTDWRRTLSSFVVVGIVLWAGFAVVRASDVWRRIPSLAQMRRSVISAKGRIALPRATSAN